jgi:hypothetical protein
MAGGITDLGAFSAGTPLDVVTGGGSGGGIGALVGMASGNPYLAGFQAITSIFGGSSVKVSKAGASGQANSGLADFGNDDSIGLGKNLIDFSDPKSVLIAGAVLVGVIYAFKKIKRF